MASLDSLPPDQRAVLQLVLQRGRSYDQIAAMLSIDRAAVRDRALSAFDAIGPQTRVAPERRALITDYLLGQLPPMVADQVYERLGNSPSERAWARIMASELAPIARDALPTIPTAGATARPQSAAPAPSEPAAETELAPPSDAPEPEPDAEPETYPQEPRRAANVPFGDERGDDDGYGRRDADVPASSRRGGAVMLAILVAVVAVIIVLVIVLSGGKSHKSHTTAANVPTSTSTAPETSSTASTSTGTTGTSGATGATGKTGTTPQKVAQFPMSSPSGAKSPAAEAEIVKENGKEGIIIVGTGVPANGKSNAYAVWLTNGGSQNKLLGFVNPAVTSNGKLETAGLLPTNASVYKQVLITLETQPKPKAPGQIVLQGELSTGG